MSSLYTAFCCEKIGAQPARWILDVGDWPDYALNASVCLYTKHFKRSASFKRAWRIEISYGGPDYLISKQSTAVESGKISVI
jgi:hypothetical protein